MGKIKQAILETITDIKNNIINGFKNIILNIKIKWNSFVELFKFKV